MFRFEHEQTYNNITTRTNFYDSNIVDIHIYMTNKRKIEIIVNASLKYGRKTRFQYATMYEQHKQFIDMLRLQDIMNEKLKLFHNIDENSELYKSIYLSAKMALLKIQETQTYNFYCATLITKIYNLEEVFNKRLKSIGTRIVDVSEQKKQQIVEQISQNDEQNEQLREIELNERREQRISSTTTGKKFLRESRKRAEIVNALLNNNL